MMRPSSRGRVLEIERLEGVGGLRGRHHRRRLSLERFEDRTLLSTMFVEAPISHGAVNNPVAITVADFNGDGIPDLATANYSTRDANIPTVGSVTIALGNGDGTFTEAPGSPVPTGTVSTDVAVGDFNGDGIPDLVVTNVGFGDGSVTILLGNGDGTFEPATGSPVGTDLSPMRVKAADFNGDGLDDFAVAHLSGLTIFVSDGSGGFTMTDQPFTRHSFSSIVAGDLDGDGHLDLVVSRHVTRDASAERGLVVLKGNGDGTFTELPGSFLPRPGAVGLILDDFTGNGILDLVLSHGGNGIVIYLGNGDGSFTPGPEAVQELRGTSDLSGVAAADLNGDGLLDVVAGHRWDGFVLVLMNQGEGQFVESIHSGYKVGELAQLVAAGDFDGDGMPDVAITGEDASFFVLLNVPLEMSIDDVSRFEGNDGSAAFTFTVSLNYDPGVPVSVDFATVAGSAVAGVDFEEMAGTITFEPGSTTRTITVLVFGNREEQEDREFFVSLSSPTAGDSTLILLARKRGVGTIWDDDSTIGFSVDQQTISEGQEAIIRVVRTGVGALNREASVRLTVGGQPGDSATQGDDFVVDFEGFSTVLTFGPGEMVKEFSVSAIADGRFEPEEGFAIVLEDIEGANPGASTVVTVIIPGTIVTVGPVEPGSRREPVSSIEISFSEAIDPATFSIDDLVLTRFGRPVTIAQGVTIDPADGSNTRFVVGGLSGSTGAKGSYEFRVDLAGIADPFGGSLEGSASTTFAVRPEISADFDGDGISDVAEYTFDEESGVGRFEVRLSSTGNLITFELGVEGDVPVVGDFDGDGRADFAVYGFDPSKGHSRFLIHHSTTGETIRLDFGGIDDTPVVGDFDGDGIVDLAVFGHSPEDGFTRFGILHSNGSPIVPGEDGSTPIGAFPIAFGGKADASVVGDFDGDGIADLAVYAFDPVEKVARYAILHSAGAPIIPMEAGKTPRGGFSIVFGGIGDVPVVGDFDGDGIADLAVFGDSPDDGVSRFAVLHSDGSPILGNNRIAPSGAFSVEFGEEGDVPIMADFDGDGRADLVVAGAGRFLIRSGPSGEDRVITFGNEGAVPLPSPTMVNWRESEQSKALFDRALDELEGGV